MSPLGEPFSLTSNPDVWVARKTPVVISARELNALKAALVNAKALRVRICTHESAEEPVHEMILALGRGTWVRPHGHPDKSESFHVIEGRASVVLFDEAGELLSWTNLGEVSSGLPFFFRISEGTYHTLFLESECLVLHETTRGPFHPGDATWAPWAPEFLPPTEVLALRDALWKQWIERQIGEKGEGR